MSTPRDFKTKDGAQEYTPRPPAVSDDHICSECGEGFLPRYSSDHYPVCKYAANKRQAEADPMIERALRDKSNTLSLPKKEARRG